jgi:eukaryotic-like serine/threonine-protein kinase
MGISMLPDLPEASYLSRFFTKFVEIVAGGLATAMCAYLIAYLGGPLSVTTPAPAAVSAGLSVATSPPAQPTAPIAAPPVAAAAVAAAAVDEQRRVPQPVTDAPPAQPARKAEKAPITVSAPKDIKTGTSVARSDKSVEALARAALANVDADRPAPAEPPNRRVSTVTGSAASAAVEVQQRPAGVPPPRQADIPPPPAAVEAPPRRIATVEPLPPPPEIAALQPEPPAHPVKGLFSFLKRGSPPLVEAPRPPMPVGTPE